MNAAAKTFAVALVSVAGAATLDVDLTNRMAAPTPEMVKLERVVVVGKRMNATIVAKLPRVVIEQHRPVSREVALSQAQFSVGVA